MYLYLNYPAFSIIEYCSTTMIHDILQYIQKRERKRKREKERKKIDREKEMKIA